jgi:hypothetical protein
MASLEKRHCFREVVRNGWLPNVQSIACNFPTGTNNGKISSAYNAVSGETITYQYDSLNR